VAANEATKNMRLKIHRGLRWPENDLKKHNNQPKTSGLDRGGDITIEDSQLCFVRCDAVEEEDTMCLWMGHP